MMNGNPPKLLDADLALSQYLDSLLQELSGVDAAPRFEAIPGSEDVGAGFEGLSDAQEGPVLQEKPLLEVRPGFKDRPESPDIPGFNAVAGLADLPAVIPPAASEPGWMRPVPVLTGRVLRVPVVQAPVLPGPVFESPVLPGAAPDPAPAPVVKPTPAANARPAAEREPPSESGPAPEQAPGLAPGLAPELAPEPESEPESRLEPAPQAALTLPVWAQHRFQCLSFQVAGLTLAVPLTRLNGIIEASDPITPMPGHQPWFLGLIQHLGRQVKVVDIGLIVVPRNRSYHPGPPRYIVLLDGYRWGIACEGITGMLTLDPEHVRWRSRLGRRPWLAGTVIDHMCAILDVDRLALDLDSGAWASSACNGVSEGTFGKPDPAPAAGNTHREPGQHGPHIHPQQRNDES